MMYCVKSRWYRQSLLGASPSPARGAGAAGSGLLAAGSGRLAAYHPSAGSWGRGGDCAGGGQWVRRTPQGRYWYCGGCLTSRTGNVSEFKLLL